MYDLIAFQRDCLYVIAGLGRPKGLAIKDELDEYYEGEINHGRLYPNLDTLVEKGLVELVSFSLVLQAWTKDRTIVDLDALVGWTTGGRARHR